MIKRTTIPRLFIILIIFGLLAYTSIIYILFDPTSNNLNDNFHTSGQKHSNTICISKSEFKEIVSNPFKQKIILFGSSWWPNYSNYPFLNETKWMCPKCIFTEDLKMFSISDLVVFHGYSLNIKPPPVELREKNQIWVYLLLEAPDYYGSYVKNTNKYTDMFNWTMTYRHDSEIHVPYGRFVSMKNIPLPKYEATWAFLPSDITNKIGIYNDSFTRIPTREELKNRRMIAWVASHCETKGKRELFVKELSRYIPIDTYGKCGNFTCDVPKNMSKSGIDCRFQISKQYKFYLSFENSLCEDYVTEKYFEVLYTQMVPIVYGNANYAKIAPKNSYINVKDFSNMKKLALYLKYLDSNPQEYLKYFEWRKNYWVQTNPYVTGYCDLCKKLWNCNHSIPQFYHNLTEWWYHRSDFKTSGQMACVP